LVAVIETSGALPFGLGFIWLRYALWTGADVSDNEQIPDYSLKRVSLINIVGAASVIVGAIIHVVDSSTNGFGLAALAQAWAAAPLSEHAENCSQGLHISNLVLSLLSDSSARVRVS
jgi:hypothetical protein